MNLERFENKIEGQEDRDFIDEMKRNFEVFDIEPKIPVIEKDKLESSDAKACFHYDENREGDDVKMINKNYFIFTENNKDIDPEHKEDLSIGLPIHEIRHRVQHENEYERPKNTERMKLFSLSDLENINDESLKNALLEYATNLPEEVKGQPREFDVKIVEKIVSNLLKSDSIKPEEVGKLLNADAPEILEYLTKFYPNYDNSN